MVFPSLSSAELFIFHFLKFSSNVSPILIFSVIDSPQKPTTPLKTTRTTTKKAKFTTFKEGEEKETKIISIRRTEQKKLADTTFPKQTTPNLESSSTMFEKDGKGDFTRFCIEGIINVWQVVILETLDGE